jgi:hypothetical protein
MLDCFICSFTSIIVLFWCIFFWVVQWIVLSTFSNMLTDLLQSSAKYYLNGLHLKKQSLFWFVSKCNVGLFHMFFYIHILSYDKLFLYFNLCPSVKLDSLSCLFTSISFLTINCSFTFKKEYGCKWTWETIQLYP